MKFIDYISIKYLIRYLLNIRKYKEVEKFFLLRKAGRINSSIDKKQKVYETIISGKNIYVQINSDDVVDNKVMDKRNILVHKFILNARTMKSTEQKVKSVRQLLKNGEDVWFFCPQSSKEKMKKWYPDIADRIKNIDEKGTDYEN